MRILMVSANRAGLNMPVVPLGMACVAEAAKQAGHEVRLLDLMNEKEPLASLARVIAEFSPQVIGVSLRNIDDQVSLRPRLLLEEDREIIEACKRLSSVPVVLGGAGYSIFPQAALDHSGADYGLAGEGERAFLELLEAFSRHAPVSSVPGLFVKGQGPQAPRPFVKELDRLPLPEPAWFDPAVFSREDFWFPIQTRRGCPNGCSYCSTAAISGKTTRKRSPRAVVEWMNRLKAAGVKRFYFVDNTFNLPRAYALKLCAELIRAGLKAPWRCILYPHLLTEPLVKAMAQAGCVEASVGFESGCEEVLELMNKRFQPEEVRSVCELLKKYQIRRLGFLLLGGPGETKDTVLQSLQFADSLKLDFLKITIGLRIYPHTPLAKRARQQGLIGPDDNLLCPRFYLVPGLESWLRETAATWAATRPHWVLDR